MWDKEVTNIFYNLCVKEIEAGNRPSTFFNKEGWANIANKFNEMTGRDYDRLKFKNKWDQLKRDWKLWKDLKRGSTGLGWDPIKRTVNASEEWWTEKLAAVPNAKKFKVCGIEPDLEDKLDVMFQGVVATGEHAFNPSEQGFAGISVDFIHDQVMGSGKGPSMNPRELESTCQSKRRKMDKRLKNKDVFVQSSIDRLIQVFEAPQAVQTVVVDPTIDDFMTVLDEIQKFACDPVFYLKSIKVLEDPTRRQIFKRLRPELRAEYLRLSIDR